MPTGYTANVRDGKATTKEFLVHLAQAFGIGGDRDYDENAEVARMEQHLRDYEVEMRGLELITPAEADQRAQAVYAAEVDRWAEDKKARAADRARYEKVLNEVRAWEVPKSIEPIKKYAIEQLVESIRFDCDRGEYDHIPVLRSGREWLAGRLDSTRKMVQIYQKELVKAEQARVEKAERRQQFEEALERV